MKTGITTELEIQYNVSKLGAIVSIPYGDCARYDHIWDINGKLLRVQIKTASPLEDGSGFKFPGKNGFTKSEVIDLYQNVVMKQNYGTIYQKMQIRIT